MYRPFSFTLVHGFILAAAALFPMTAPTRYQPTEPVGTLISGTLSFTGHATVGGEFVGRTSTVAGEFTGDLLNPTGWVESPVATLSTRNSQRDRDMRASLEAGRYPMMRLDVCGATVVASQPARGDTLEMLLHGRLSIHGVTRAVDVPALVVTTAKGIDVTAAFPLDLADYDVGGLTKMFGLLRMERRIDVTAKLRFVTVDR